MAGQRAESILLTDKLSEAARMLAKDIRVARANLEGSRMFGKPIDPEPLARVIGALGFFVDELVHHETDLDDDEEVRRAIEILERKLPSFFIGSKVTTAARTLIKPDK